jgi:hypothetical protein
MECHVELFDITINVLFLLSGVRPEFVSLLKNVTIPIGRDAMFSCNVKNLGLFRVRIDQGTVYFLAHFCPVAFFRQMIALKITLLALFLVAQNCLWTRIVRKSVNKIYYFE